MKLLTYPRRDWCYVQRPSDYEISGCPKCGGHNTWWSEWWHHVWCYDCQIDYLPEFSGVFDGPVSIGICKLLGISFDRHNLLTGQIETVHIEDKRIIYRPLDETKIEQL